MIDRDKNEEFICGQCMKPVETRVIFCSEECSEQFTNSTIQEYFDEKDALFIEYMKKHDCEPFNKILFVLLDSCPIFKNAMMEVWVRAEQSFRADNEVIF